MLRQRLKCIRPNAEPCPVHSLLAKHKLLWVLEDATLADKRQELHGVLVHLFDSGFEEQAVVDLALVIF